MRLESRLPAVRLIRDYYDHPLYIQALAARIQNHWKQKGRAEHLLISFHSIPVRYVEQGDPYKIQCIETAQKLTEVLSLREEQWSLVYQSQFGREPWLQPYTDQSIRHLVRQGIRSLDVICPGFSCDCLETLEEINIRYQNLFLSLGGEKFSYITALNDHPEHIRLMTTLVYQEIG